MDKIVTISDWEMGLNDKILSYNFIAASNPYTEPFTLLTTKLKLNSLSHTRTRLSNLITVFIKQPNFNTLIF
jgi:hypothetical protein